MQESHKHLKSKGFYDNPNTEEFEITQQVRVILITVCFISLLQLCICLNDIEYVREELSKIPVALKFDAIISRLSEVEGDEQAANARHTLTNMIEAANDNVVVCIDELVHSVGEQVRNDLAMKCMRILFIKCI